MTAQIQSQLLHALKKIDRPGTFCTSGRLPTTFSGSEVAGVGPVASPLEKRQAAALKKHAGTPYGKGTKTVVDTDVRRVWEIDADQVALKNDEWPASWPRPSALPRPIWVWRNRTRRSSLQTVALRVRQLLFGPSRRGKTRSHGRHAGLRSAGGSRRRTACRSS